MIILDMIHDMRNLTLDRFVRSARNRGTPLAWAPEQEAAHIVSLSCLKKRADLLKRYLHQLGS